jgi:hypothetical protein
MAKAKKTKAVEPHWNDLVNVFFEFTKDKFKEVPSFDGSAPRDLKNIIQTLRKRAEDKQVDWTFEVATTRFRHFLECCYEDRWLSENWLLMNISRQKDKIFFSIAKKVQWLGQ